MACITLLAARNTHSQQCQLQPSSDAVKAPKARYDNLRQHSMAVQATQRGADLPPVAQYMMPPSYRQCWVGP